MIKLSQNNNFMQKVLAALLIIICITFISFADETDETGHDIGQSILDRYTQIVLQSFDYYREKLGFSENQVSLDLQNFPVLYKNNLKHVITESFHTERYFSKLHQLEKKLQQAKAKQTKQVATANEVIKISNIPVDQGYLSSQFGLRKDPIHGFNRHHKGIDIAASYGAVVNPLGKGKVIFSGYKQGYGNTVEIKHGNTVLTRYAHLKQLLVDQDQLVTIEDQIGLIGKSGRSTGPHLHLEVLLNGEQVDPQIFLANHFGSRTNPYRIASRKKVQLIKKHQLASVKSFNKRSIASKNTETTNNPQITYYDYVKSVDGLFGFSAPESISQ